VEFLLLNTKIGIEFSIFKEKDIFRILVNYAFV